MDALLQLGRGLSTAETQEIMGRAVWWDPASIGPRSCNRGNVMRQSIPGLRCWALLLGRSPSTAETVCIVIRVAYGLRLQVGRRLSTAETRTPRIPIAVTNQLQLGRGLSTAETDEAGLNFPARSWLQLGRGLFKLAKPPASIGPRSSNRGNARA